MKTWMLVAALLVGCVTSEEVSPEESVVEDAPDWCVEECRSISPTLNPVCCNHDWTYNTCECACDPVDCGGEEEE